MDLTDNVKILALRLLNKFDEHISAQLILLRYKRNAYHSPGFDGEKGPIGFTGLHGAAFLGLVEIFAALLEMKEWDVNSRDSASCTPLLWAARWGHEEVVQMLLERRDVDLGFKDQYDETPLSRAAQQGHEGVVKVFLEREGVNPDQGISMYVQQALHRAAAYGHERIVKMIWNEKTSIPTRYPPDIRAHHSLSQLFRGMKR